MLICLIVSSVLQFPSPFGSVSDTCRGVFIDDRTLEELLGIDGGATHDGEVVTFHGAGNARLCTDIHVVAHADVSCQSDLPAEHAPFAHLGRACDTDLGCHHGVASHFHIVGNLDQVVQLDSLVYDGCSHGGTVHARIGADFHIILQHGDTDLRNLLVAFRRGCKTKSVGAYHTSGMKDAPFADAAVMVYGDIRIKYAVFADDSVLTYGRMWMESYPVADDGIGADIGKGIDIDVLPDFAVGSMQANGWMPVFFGLLISYKVSSLATLS